MYSVCTVRGTRLYGTFDSSYASIQTCSDKPTRSTPYVLYHTVTVNDTRKAMTLLPTDSSGSKAEYFSDLKPLLPQLGLTQQSTLV